MFAFSGRAAQPVENYWQANVIVLACLVALVFSNPSVCQAKIRVVKQWYAAGPGGLAWSHVKIETSIDSDAIQGSGAPTISSEIAYPGTMTATFPENKEIVTNKARMIVALNFRPAVGVTDIYLLVQSSSGQLLVINDLNDRLATLSKNLHKEFNREDVRAQKIIGDKLYLKADIIGAGPYYHYELTVRVLPDGRLRLLHYVSQ